jgi:CheY-like chemotaxis protein
MSTRVGQTEISCLLIEDSEEDHHLLRRLLGREPGSFNLAWAGTLAGGAEAARGSRFDVVLLDLHLPDSAGIDTVRRAVAALGELPIVVLTGSDDPDLARQAIQAGAQDYLPKGGFDLPLLSRVIRYAIERQRILRDRERVIAELEQAVVRIEALTGLLPICAACKKVRDDRGEWGSIESYLRHRTGQEITHGICPECVGRLYPDLGLARR